jgi:hypothetical protein
MDRFEAALVKWNVFGDEAAETVDNGAVGDGFGGVDIGVDFWSGT